MKWIDMHFIVRMIYDIGPHCSQHGGRSDKATCERKDLTDHVKMLWYQK